MKRTPLARKSPLKAKAPMARKPIKRKAARKQSTDKRWRSEKYLAFVRSLPCCVCGTTPCDPHHVIGLGWQLSGTGLTAPDSFAMPLCRACHDQVHRDPFMQAEQPRWLRQTIIAGLHQFTGETANQLSQALALIDAKETA
jgi:hypothetical protein